MPRDYESENYAIANGYDLADRASEAWSEEPPEAPEESEAERLSYALYNLRGELTYTRRILAGPLYAHHRDMYFRHLTEVEAGVARLEAKVAAALERERAEEGL